MTMPKGWTPEKINKDARNYSTLAESRKWAEQQQAAAKANCYCGHTQTLHNREFRINRGTMPKGMKTVESKTDVGHSACSMCGCTNYIEREFSKRMGESWENFVKPQQQQVPQQQKIRRSDGSWFYYSSNTYVMPVEDTGRSDDNDNNKNDTTTTDVDTVDGDYEF